MKRQGEKSKNRSNLYSLAVFQCQCNWLESKLFQAEAKANIKKKIHQATRIVWLKTVYYCNTLDTSNNNKHNTKAHIDQKRLRIDINGLSVFQSWIHIDRTRVVG